MVQDLEKRKQEHISEALAYACRYWASHVSQMDPNDYPLIREALHDFLIVGKHLMQWTEVISLTGSIDIVKKAMRALVRWYKVRIITYNVRKGKKRSDHMHTRLSKMAIQRLTD